MRGSEVYLLTCFIKGGCSHSACSVVVIISHIVAGSVEVEARAERTTMAITAVLMPAGGATASVLVVVATESAEWSNYLGFGSDA